MDADRTLADIASAHGGLVTRTQARAAGISSKVLQNRVRRGSWVLVEPGVYGPAAVPLSWEQRARAASLAEAGLASHRTAAALWHLDGCRPGVIEIVTERWRRRPNRSVRVHETTSLPAEDRDVVDGIPVTSRARTIVDLAAVLPVQRVEQALDSHGVDPVAVWECADRLAGRGRPWATRVRALAARRIGADGVKPNMFERMLFDILEQAGLPTPQAQVEILRTDGTLIGRVDWVFDDRPVILECDSFLFHGQWVRRKADMRRDRELIALGYRVLRFSWEDLTEYPDVVVRDIAGARAVSA